MSLIACTECGKQVSTEANTCPSCGCPVPKQARNDPAAPTNATPAVVPGAPGAQSVLLQVRPSWWNFSWHLVLFVVVVPLLIVFCPSRSGLWAGLTVDGWSCWCFTRCIGDVRL